MSNRLKLLREAATRPRRTVPLLLDGEVRGQIEAVEDELDRLDPDEVDADRRQSSKSAAARLRELKAEAQRLRDAAVGTTLYVVVEGLSRTPYRALVAAHPPRRDEQGKVVPADVRLGVDTDAIQIPLARACIVGHQETDDSAAEVLPLDESRWDGDEFAPGMVDFLLGYSVEHPTTGAKAQADPFCTDRQIELLANAAFVVCRGDDAVPLPRLRSQTQTSAAG